MYDNNMLYNYDYLLKWKDVDVIQFNIKRSEVEIRNRSFLPLSICSLPESFDMIHKFCGDRVLMFNREYSKEILTSCGIDNQTPLEICLISRALSFRDNYWICKKREQLLWRDVNLYENVFSNQIARVSLTGEYDYVDIRDDIYTGELTGKGSRAKCYFREDGNLFLYKNELNNEIIAKKEAG